MILKILLIIMFVILLSMAVFCLYVLAKIGGITTDMEEQIEIERKLK